MRQTLSPPEIQKPAHAGFVVSDAGKNEPAPGRIPQRPSDHFPRIHDAVRIERPLDGAHQFHFQR